MQMIAPLPGYPRRGGASNDEVAGNARTGE